VAKILVVDDEETERVGLAGILEKAGHEVTVAADGNEALAAYVRERFAVVVTDMVMPGRDGLGLISALKQVDPNAKIVAVSGKSRSQLEASTIFGADEVLAKPIDPEKLLATVAELAPRRS